MHTLAREIDPFDPSPSLDFAWLELTNRCNLTCSHCYAESSPYSGQHDLLTEDHYIDLIQSLHDVGCRRIQFIGGEPTLNRSLPKLIKYCRLSNFETIEVFSNLYHLDENLLDCFRQNDVAVATSFYSNRAEVHDRITNRQGSFAGTTANIKRVISAGIDLRIGVIIMEENCDHADETRNFLSDLGAVDVGFDRMRHLGRAAKSDCCGVEELCGSCAGGSIAISPDGTVTPCAMAKRMAVGSVLEQSLGQILVSKKLVDVRRKIYDTVVIHNHSTIDLGGGCNPCVPNSGPCRPNNNVIGTNVFGMGGCKPCGPNGGACKPNGR